MKNNKVLGVVFLALMLAGGVGDLRRVHQEVHRLRRGRRSRPPRSGCSCRMRADVKIRGVIVGEVLDYRADRRRRRHHARPLPGPRHRHPGATSPRSILPEDALRREVRLPDRPRGRLVRRDDRRPATSSSAPTSPPRSSRCSATSTRCCARCSRPTSTSPSTRSRPRSRAGATSSARASRRSTTTSTRFNPEIPALDRGPAAHRPRSPTRTPTCCPRSRRSCATPSPPRRRSRTARRSSRRSSTTSSQFSAVGRALHPRPTATTSSGSASSARAQLEVLRALRPRVPLPARAASSGAGKLQAEAFRGFTLHIVLETLPNQPRGYGPAGRPGLRRQARPLLRARCPTPPWTQGNPVTAPAQLRRRRRRAHRQGHQSRAAPAGPAPPPATPAAATSRPCSRPARPRPRRQRRRRTRPRRAARRADGARRAEVIAAMSPLLDKKTSVDLVKLLVFIVVTSLATACWS